LRRCPTRLQGLRQGPFRRQSPPQYRGIDGVVAKRPLVLVHSEAAEPGWDIHALPSGRITTARAYCTPVCRSARIFSAACRSPRSRGASCSNGRGDQPFWWASATPSRKADPALAKSAMGQDRPIFAPARSRSQGPLSDQVADAPNPRGECRSWVDTGYSPAAQRTVAVSTPTIDRPPSGTRPYAGRPLADPAPCRPAADLCRQRRERRRGHHGAGGWAGGAGRNTTRADGLGDRDACEDERVRLKRPIDFLEPMSLAICGSAPTHRWATPASCASPMGTS
jgi:hypothetical protein